MPREYRHIEEYEKEIIQLWEEGKTLREISERLGFSYRQVRNFKTRYNEKQRKARNRNSKRVVRNILPSPKLNRTFTNKVDALNYLNKVISQGYKHSKIEKWEGN